MPLILPSSFDSREDANSATDYIWLVEVQLRRSERISTSPLVVSAPLVARLCSDVEVITWPASNPTTQTWSPFNFSISAIEENSDGDLPELQLTVSNHGRILMPTLHDGDAFEGNPCTIYLVPRASLSIAYPNHQAQRWDLIIASASATDEAVTFRLARQNFFAKVVPQDRFIAQRCRWQFGSSQCGYVLNSSAGFQECPKTLEACAARGQDHLARGLPVLHPARFGGFPGIPKQQ